MTAVTSAIASQLTTVNTVVLLHIVGALEGTALGLTQWLVLRHYIKHMGWWILSTVIGAIAAWLISLQVTVILILIFSNSAFVTTSAALGQGAELPDLQELLNKIFSASRLKA